MKRAIYLDYAAATPLDETVLASMQPYFANDFYNPSALYLASKNIRAKVSEARASVAKQLSVRPGEIIFTAGGTEANNIAIHGIMTQYPEANMLLSSIEHDSVRLPAKQYKSSEVPVLPDGRINIDGLAEAINDQTVLVSVVYANNEIGTIQPLREISQVINELRNHRKNKGNNLPLLFHTDACQAMQYLDIHPKRLGVDLMTMNGGKIYGPKQSGALYVQSGVKLTPILQGGGQEFAIRNGTENVPSIIGFSKALEQITDIKKTETKRMRQLQDLFLSELKIKVPKATINGSRTHRLPNNIHVTVVGTDNERVIMLLDEAGIQAAAGSACSASKDEPSHVLRALGLGDDESRASYRFTMGRQTTEADVRTAVDTFAACIV